MPCDFRGACPSRSVTLAYLRLHVPARVHVICPVKKMQDSARARPSAARWFFALLLEENAARAHTAAGLGSRCNASAMRAFPIPCTRLSAACRAAGRSEERHRGCTVPGRARDKSDNTNDYPEATRPTTWPPSSMDLFEHVCLGRPLVDVVASSSLSCMLQCSRDLHQKDASSVWWQPMTCRPRSEYGPFSIRCRTSIAVSARLLIGEQMVPQAAPEKTLAPKPDEPARGSGNLTRPSFLVLPFPAILQEHKLPGCRVRCACVSCPTAHRVLSLMIRSTFSS